VRAIPIKATAHGRSTGRIHISDFREHALTANGSRSIHSGRDWPLEPRHVPPAELDIPIFGQLATTHLPLGDAFEPGPLEVISLDVALRGLAAQTISAGTRDAGP